MFFVPAFLFTGEKGNRFIITALWRGGKRKSFVRDIDASFFFFFKMANTLPQAALVPLGTTRPPHPVAPSPSLCRLAQAGGGAVKFQHLLYIPPNYYELLLRLPSLSLPPPLPSVPGGASQRPWEKTVSMG